ncbi:hypothetical protein LPJ61_002646, partial [Coemansia biformis]
NMTVEFSQYTIILTYNGGTVSHNANSDTTGSDLKAVAARAFGLNAGTIDVKLGVQAIGDDQALVSYADWLNPGAANTVLVEQQVQQEPEEEEEEVEEPQW